MPNILCTPSFSDKEMADITALSILLGKPPEDVVRMAVKKFSSVCVPTQQDRKRKTA